MTRFAFIDREKALYDVTVLCRLLKVSRSGFYAWVARPPSPRVVADGVLTVQIQEAFDSNRKVYGSPRVHAELVDAGVLVGSTTVESTTDSDGRPQMKYVGWDWASRGHDVTVIDDRGSVLDRWAFSHTESGWTTTVHRLGRHGDPGDLPVIIERTSGLVIDRLLAAGHPVVPVHPTSFYAARPRWSASGAKSDPGDSFKLADYLRTDGHRLRRLEPTDPGLRELQALVRLRDDQVRARTAATKPAHRDTGRALAGSQGPFPIAGVADRIGGPHRLPNPAVRRTPGRSPDGRVPASPLLPWREEPSRPAGPAARRSNRRDRSSRFLVPDEKG